MGGGTADEIPLLEPILDHQRHEMALLPVPDELLAEILLRLPTPADLVRASAACVSFRRVAAHRSFLCRYRKIHALPLLGFLERSKRVFYPVTPPYPSASAASAVALAADFSFSFLPAPASDWVIKDIRDGRILLYRRMRVHNSTVVFPEVVVCDPLHRRYLLLPPITYDLAASVEDPILTKKRRLRVEIFLVPTGDGEEEAATTDETSFRVVWMAQCKARLVAFVFSSNTRQWRAVPSRRWADLSAGLPPLTAKSLFYWRHYVYGCFYWLTAADCQEIKLLVLDTKTMGFSIAEPPPEANSCNFAMVEASQGRPGMFVLAFNGFDLSYFIRQNDGGSSSQWQKVKTISVGSWSHLICNMEKYLLLYQPRSSLLEPGCFTLDIETFQLEKVCAIQSSFYKLHAYSNFPPSLLSSPTISSAWCGEVTGGGVVPYITPATSRPPPVGRHCSSSGKVSVVALQPSAGSYPCWCAPGYQRSRRRRLLQWWRRHGRPQRHKLEPAPKDTRRAAARRSRFEPWLASVVQAPEKGHRRGCSCAPPLPEPLDSTSP